jgi:hypothetical protein
VKRAEIYLGRKTQKSPFLMLESLSGADGETSATIIAGMDKGFLIQRIVHSWGETAGAMARSIQSFISRTA